MRHRIANGTAVMYTQTEGESNRTREETDQLRKNGNSPKNTKTRVHHHLVVRVFKWLGSASRTRTYNPAVTVDSGTFVPVRTISSPFTC